MNLWTGRGRIFKSGNVNFRKLGIGEWIHCAKLHTVNPQVIKSRNKVSVSESLDSKQQITTSGRGGVIGQCPGCNKWSRKQLNFQQTNTFEQFVHDGTLSHETFTQCPGGSECLDEQVAGVTHVAFPSLNSMEIDAICNQIDCEWICHV